MGEGDGVGERGGRKERNGARRRGENGFERWEGRRMDKLCDWIVGRAINKRESEMAFKFLAQVGR